MNRKKKNQLIILCVFFLVVLAAFAALRINQKNTSGGAEDEAESYSVIDIDKSLVTQVGIIGSGGTTDLEKDGDGWKYPEDESILIDDGIVDTFLDSATSITSETKIEEATDMSQYGLEEPALNITLQWSSNMYSIRLGDYNSITGGYYISINDENTVYIVDSSCFYSLNKSLEDFKQVAAQDEASTEAE